MPSETTKRRAILLLGPTGSGKTPLGERIEARGLWGERCIHFDFGDALREVVARNQPDEIVGPEDIAFLREVLRTGALLEEDRLPLALGILRSFLHRRRAGAETVVVLNGLPRHVGQALAVEAEVDVRAVVHLACDGETVLRRIASNIGGDRARRCDDDLEAIRNKLAIFATRTSPLLEHYRARGAAIETLEVGATMTPDDAWRELERRKIAISPNCW